MAGIASYTDAGGATQTTSTNEHVRNTSPIKINEYRIGSTGNGSNSFIELYNAGSSTVDLSGWKTFPCQISRAAWERGRSQRLPVAKIARP